MWLFRFFQLIGLLSILAIIGWMAWLGFFFAQVLIGLLAIFVVWLAIGVSMLAAVLGAARFFGE